MFEKFVAFSREKRKRVILIMPLVTTKEMFEKSMKEGFAIRSF